jgi:RND superfamily putative drug exporter
MDVEAAHQDGGIRVRGDGQQRPVGGSSIFYRIGGFSHRRRFWILGVWIVVLVAFFPAVKALNDHLSQGGFEVPGSQSDQVKHDIDTVFSRNQAQFNDLLVMHSDTLVATDPAFKSTALRVIAALRRGPGVASSKVGSPYSAPQRFISRDGHTLTATIPLSDTQSEALKHDPDLEGIVARASDGSGIQTLLTGDAPFYKAFSDTTTHDLTKAERIAFPITLVILILAFGSLIAAGVPLIMAVFGLVIAFGIVSLIATHATVSIFTENTMSMLGLGVGIDYSLFIVSRFRERLATGRDVPTAIAEATASSGKAVFVSALTVVLALSGTQLVRIAAFASMGYGAMIAVALAGIGALTLLPAILGMLGTRVNKLRIRRQRVAETGGWHRWSMFIMRRPWPALVAGLGVILILAAPALNLRLGSSGPNILPADAGPRVAARITGQAFGEGQIAPVQIVVTDPRGVAGPGFADLYRFVQAAERDPEVRRVDSIATLVPNQTEAQARAFVGSALSQQVTAPMMAGGGTKTLVSVISNHGAQATQTDALVQRLRADARRIFHGPISAEVGGDPGLNTDLNHELTAKLPYVVGLVLLLSFFVLLLFFRSILLPLKALLMNLASVIAAYGMMVFVFQEGHFEGVLSFTSVGFIDSFLPLFMFSILFGLSMDYEVFLLARIREEYLKSGDNTEAVAWGLEHTGGLITSAAAIMITVFGAFALGRLLPIKELGFGLAAAVLVDATLIRVMLVPATMRLLGKWNWWLPKWIDRRLPNVSLEGLREAGPPAEEPVPATL